MELFIKYAKKDKEEAENVLKKDKNKKRLSWN
jgi:hypothetical protein